MVSDTTVGQTSDPDLTDIEDRRDDAPAHTFAREVDILSTLLAMPDLGKTVYGVWYSKRHNIEFPIRAITSDEFEKLNKDHTIRKRIGKTTQIHSELENEQYNYDVVRLGCMKPDFNDAGVRREISARIGKPNLNTVTDCIKHVFLIGEIFRLAAAILELSGFEDEEDTVNSLKG